MKLYLKTALGLTALAATAAAYSGTTTNTMAVSATVAIACSVSATPLTFGTVTANNQTANSPISVNCPSGLAYKVALDKGLHGARGFSRKMSNGAGIFLSYSVSKPASTAQWGDGDFDSTYPDGTSVAGTGAGAAQTLTATGSIPTAGATPGTFSDTITITVHF